MKIEYLAARSSIRRTENEKEISFELQFLALAVALEVVIVGSSHARSRQVPTPPSCALDVKVCVLVW